MSASSKSSPLPVGTRVQLQDGRVAVLVSIESDINVAVIRFDDDRIGAQPVGWLTPLPN